ncbi:CLAVATA3/ESR (CLE)-related protein 25 isoform X2 [Sesamum indicum]|uniref:CLAVATA3/ESR (CLE)-related protein 25 isoform X2 n=1 Tax=Sesamum indicum TaxID=4182 RepID=A0A6I9TS46_SESIN|nr:CLAVATA3/ESR (CLE)-related protein 25 isoform X2 [Sesamum indicum]
MQQTKKKTSKCSHIHAPLLEREMSSTSEFLKAFLRLLFLLGVVRFLIVGASGRGAGVRKTKDGATGLANGGRRAGVNVNLHVDHGEVSAGLGRRTDRVLSKVEINYMSKRRVPNGPDPIHNRRAGNSHQPPAQA